MTCPERCVCLLRMFAQTGTPYSRVGKLGETMSDEVKDAQGGGAPPEDARRLYKAREGYANYYFNELNRSCRVLNPPSA